MRSTNVAWAVLLARLVLGLIFAMAGWHKVFVMGPVAHAEKWFLPFADSLPTWSLWVAGTVIPFVELIAGALCLFGLWLRPALLALGAVLVTVTFGHLLQNPLYPFHEHVVPRLALVLFVLMVPSEQDRFALDAWRRGRTGR
jgi:uncharacterized membrane protein YphA (DoxX/SURF4 family)